VETNKSLGGGFEDKKKLDNLNLIYFNREKEVISLV
jgi:hypothetical protein